ncbi:MAG TPA: Fe-S cluster assembly protein SufD [Gammaproteobacteria bacterium]|nr:Fe-S cluster assembly protein SufD [Gammaproteobacteria bacterium]
MQPYLEHFKVFSAGAGAASGWLPALRQQAMESFTRQGFPAARSENWKYTPTRPLEKRRFMPIEAEATQSAPDVPDTVRLREVSTHTLTFVNGRPMLAPDTTTRPVGGLHFTRLDAALGQASARVEELLAPETAWNHDPFSALNTAFLRDGIVITLDDGVVLEAPIQLLFVSTPDAQPRVCHPRILIRLGRGARATLLQTWFGQAGAANFTNSYTQVTLQDCAQLEHLHLHREAADEFHVNRVEVSQQAGSRYVSHTLNLGGLWLRTDLHTRLEAEQAETVLNGLYHVDDRRHVDNHTRIDHLAPATRSDELYRGIVSGHAHAVFNGKVWVAEGAAGTDAAQANHNLLLSRQAEIDTKPELEIYADDVKCSHGATVGQLDDNALFYLRARGLDDAEARSLLTGAFALAVLNRIGSPPLRTFACRQLGSLLPQSILQEET